MASLNPNIIFLQRSFPSANSVLVLGDAPILIDSGFGSDADETVRLLESHSLAPDSLQCVVNTHYHADHCGGNFRMQSEFVVSIAAHRIEADAINTRAASACQAAWLDQPVEPYHVDRILNDGDTIETGSVTLRVIHAPGHTRGMIALFDETTGSVICGDVVHADDVAWLNPFGEGTDSLGRACDSIRLLAALKPAWSCSGHGPDTADPAVAYDAALKRYATWAEDPSRIGWHACKRIFAYRLMIVSGIHRAEVESYLLKQEWYRDYAESMFGHAPDAFVGPFMDEMIRSRAAAWDGDRLVAGAPFREPAPGWQTAPSDPCNWPPAKAG